MNLVTHGYIVIAVILSISVVANILILYIGCKWLQSKTSENHSWKDFIGAYLSKTFGIRLQTEEDKKSNKDNKKKAY